MANNSSSTAVGNSNDSTNTASSAFGFNNTASRFHGGAFGSGCIASGGSTFAGGRNSIASGGQAVAIGLAVLASGSDSVALGTNAQATNRCVAIGDDAEANNGNEQVSIGARAGNVAGNQHAVCVGADTQAAGDGGVAVGRAANGAGFESLSLGRSSVAGASNATIRPVAVGPFASATADYSNAFGQGVQNTLSDSLEIGSWDDRVAAGVFVRNSAIRMDENGHVNSTVVTTDTLPTDGGTTQGSEAANTLMRNSYRFQRGTNGSVLLVLNDGAGNITTLNLGLPT